MNTYISKSANEAKEMNYGNEDYWDYLENHALELFEYFSKKGDQPNSKKMLERSLSEALAGNNGE